MIRRVSTWKLKNKNSADKIKIALLTLKENVPSLSEIEVHINISKHQQAYDLIFIGTFSNRETLEVFDNDHFHKKVSDQLKSWSENRIVIEYEY